MKKTRSGSALVLLLAALILTVFSPPALSKDKKAGKQQPATYGIVSGTVFRVPGFALPGASVTVTPEASERDGVNFKKFKVVTDARGEFAVRVPAVPMKYTLNVKSKGFQGQDKSVTIEGEQRKEVTFQLEPEAK